MKKIVNILLLGVFALSLNACKKGENDPFLSLRSRDGRLTGTWDLTSASTTEVNTFSGTSTTVTGTYDGTTWTTSGGGSSFTQSYSLKITFEKDGSYMSELVIDGDRQETTGQWWWLNDASNKTRIALDDDWGSFLVDQLKNKEMILMQSSSTVDNGDTDSFEGTWTYTKE